MGKKWYPEQRARDLGEDMGGSVGLGAGSQANLLGSPLGVRVQGHPGVGRAGPTGGLKCENKAGNSQWADQEG